MLILNALANFPFVGGVGVAPCVAEKPVPTLKAPLQRPSLAERLREVAFSSAEPEDLSLVIEGADCVTTDTTLVNLSESENETSMELATFADLVPCLEWTEHAQSVSLTSTRAVLTLAGVHVLNMSIPEVLPRLWTGATITSVEIA